MEEKSEKMLPKTAEQIRNGGIYSQRVRCGKVELQVLTGCSAYRLLFLYAFERKTDQVLYPKSRPFGVFITC